MVRLLRVPVLAIRLLSLAGVWLSASLVHPAEPATRTIEFNRDVRPILSDICFQCHGPDQKQRKADLRLDTEEGALADLGGRRAIVAGKPDDSELYLRIIATDPAEKMPPEKSGKKLSPLQIETLRLWIAQ